MRLELIFIALIALAASLSAYAQDAADDLHQPAKWTAPAPEQGYQEGLCTVSLR